MAKRKKGASRPNANSDGSKKKIGTMDLILIIVGVLVLAFTIKMIDIFQQYGAVPDMLITCFFALCGGECGILGWIKTKKDRTQEREWQLKERKLERKWQIEDRKADEARRSKEAGSPAEEEEHPRNDL